MTKVSHKTDSCTIGITECPLTSLRYNRGQLSTDAKKPLKNYLFSVDTLVLNCIHGQGTGLLRHFDKDDVLEEYEYRDIKLIKDKKTGGGTKRYKHGFEFIYNNQSIGLLLLCSRQVLKKNSEYQCSFKVHNHILYQKAWSLVVECALSQLGVIINNATYLDIACDGHGFVAQYQKLLNGEYENIGRATHRPSGIRKGVVEGFYVGKRKSDKCMCGYYKSVELGVSNKGYIKEFWQKNNLANIDSVERLELRLRNKGVKSIVGFSLSKRLGDSVVGFTLERLEDQEYLAGIFKSQTDNYYQFVLQSDLDRDSKVSRHKKISVIEWENLEFDEIMKATRIKKPSSIWGAKRAITFGLQNLHAGYHCDSQNLFDENKQFYKNEEYIRLKAIAERYEILDWFQSLVKRIAKRDKALIAEMRFNRLELEAGEVSIYKFVNH